MAYTGRAPSAAPLTSGDITDGAVAPVDLSTGAPSWDTSGNLTVDGGAVFNEAGADVDFRVESDTNANAFFLEGSSGNVGIGTSSPAAKLHLQGAAATAVNTDFIYRPSGDNTNNYQIVGLYNASGSTSGAFPNQSVGFSSDVNGGFGVSGGFVLNTDTDGGPLIFGTNNTERMRITSAGALELTGDSGAGQTFLNFTANSNITKAQISGAKAGSNGGTLSFSTNNSSGTLTERMRIDSSGNLLVGTTGVPNGTSIYGSAFVPSTSSRTRLVMASNNTNNIQLTNFFNPNGEVGSINTNGSATSYNTSSDYRLKEDWQPMSGSIDRLKNLNPVNFAWKVDGTRVDGFLAHEAAEVVPEAVSGEKDAVDEDGNPVMQGIDQSKLVPLLTAALQEAIAKIESLETRIATLEGA
jgi:hypothetical protein